MNLLIGFENSNRQGTYMNIGKLTSWILLFWICAARYDRQVISNHAFEVYMSIGFATSLVSGILCSMNFVIIKDLFCFDHF